MNTKSPECEPSDGGGHSSDNKKSGLALALGGGAAKGFAHIPMLEALDELGVRPAQISGTSMGALLGSFYANGMSGADIRAYAIDLFARRRPLLKKLFLDSGRPLSSLLNLTRPSLIDPMVLFDAVLPPELPESFSGLSVPMKIVATDFHSQGQVILEEGALMPAIAASCALPVLLTPIRHEGLVLIDGGFVNPTPFDILDKTSHHTVGIDVTINKRENTGKLPGGLETWIGSFNITLHSIVAEKLKHKSPDLLVTPPVGRYSTADFFKIEDILTTVDASKDGFKRSIEKLLEAT